MCDKLVFDLAQEIEATPSVFVRKDWINILDNQNQNYNNNQSVIDTSQLSNSNKYMGYREAYLAVPMVLSIGSISSSTPSGNFTSGATVSVLNTTTASDYCAGLKNWFGQIIHSFTLDYNGTTIIQQTPYINFWNSFKLMTSLSYGDIISQGATIGFYPDDPTTFTIQGTASTTGKGICNNTNLRAFDAVNALTTYSAGKGNIGFLKRQQLINFDGAGVAGASAYASLVGTGAGTITSGAAWASQLWKSCIYNKVNGSITTTASSTTYSFTKGIIQMEIMGIIYLKHIHSFFNMCPLVKGAFMKMTMNLNNTTTEFTGLWTNGTQALDVVSVSSPLGGVNPIMIASGDANNGGDVFTGTAVDGQALTITYRANISVGRTCLDSTLATITGYQPAAIASSIYLYVPAYTFNPVFEQAYLSTPVKVIKYTDVYQYQVLNIGGGGSQNFNNLLTNGIANVKSVLLLPFYSFTGKWIESLNASYTFPVPVFQSPFDPAGTGPTSPLCHLTNFNVQVSGQNAIYNLQKYSFEQFNNQLYGQNAVNGGLTDGLTSGLVDRQAFDLNYCYYYVNIERMLPVEQSVPKSIQILGQNTSFLPIDLYCFVEYGQEISIDILTGARV